ncbi:MAG: hypothetical protein HJJLKODD_01686 [Phycisphaerae bacterium]|nr:hypothetical protein [Phycisphaerae bacterium]
MRIITRYGDRCIMTSKYYFISDHPRQQAGRSAFTLLELLVVTGIISLLLSVLLPSLVSARQQAHNVLCLARLRELDLAFTAYTLDHHDMCMPGVYWQSDIIGNGPTPYWWGTVNFIEKSVDHRLGFLWPYFQLPHVSNSIFECPRQPWGSYSPAPGGWGPPTSTYGYNSYYLASSYSGFGDFPNHSWLNITEIKQPSQVFVFSDTLLQLGSQVFNNYVLEPPNHFSGGEWNSNPSPNTAFRHQEKAQAVSADGHAETYEPGDSIHTTDSTLIKLWSTHRIASVGNSNDPHYVPDWEDWME